MRTLVFEKASVICNRIFDVGNEIDLEHARRLVSEDARRLKLGREGSEYLQLPNPPVTISLGKRPLKLRGGEIQADASVRIFDHGAMSVGIEVPVHSGANLEQLIVLVDELFDSKAVEALAVELVEATRRSVASATESPHRWEQFESYTVVFAEKLFGDPTTPEILERSDQLARLLLGEVRERNLSPREQRDVTQQSFAYGDRDLVLIDWNSAFVYEPSGSRDIPDILEIANAQLLELRYYDEQLDGHITHIYNEMQRRSRRHWLRIFRSPYRALERRVLVTLLELSEFIERVENSLKIIGDFYLAKVYESAVRRLRVPAWQASVTRKQQMLERVYQLLKGEVDTDRALTLEATIVILIVSEIFMALTRLM